MTDPTTRPKTDNAFLGPLKGGALDPTYGGALSFMRRRYSRELNNVDLVVCVAAALRRGIKDEVLAPGFRISGLGQLIDAGIKSDRLVTFGD